MFDRAAYSFIYARLQHRLGRRLSKSQWQHLGASKSLGHYLETARQTGVGPWITRLTSSSDVHTIEKTLRQEWRWQVKQIAKWHPKPWQASLLWLADLAELPLLVEQNRERTVKVQIETAVDAPSRAFVQNSDWPQDQPPGQLWLDEFKRLWPASSQKSEHLLKAAVGVFKAGFSTDRLDVGKNPFERRDVASTKLVRLFRRNPQSPVASFAYLGLLALDMEHLRAHLIYRALFPEVLNRR